MMSDYDKHVELLNKIQKVIEKHGLIKTYEHAADDEGLFGTYTFSDALNCANGDVMKVDVMRTIKECDSISYQEEIRVSFAASCYAANFNVCHKIQVNFSMWRDINVIDENFEEICDYIINKLRREFEKELSIATENSKMYHIKQIKKAGEDYVC